MGESKLNLNNNNLEYNEINREQLIEIINKLSQSNSDQYKYFLNIQMFTNMCHPTKTYRESYEILLGEVKEIVVHEKEDQCYRTSEIYLLPLTDKVVVHFYGRGGEPQDKFDDLYVFTFEKGWQQVNL